MGEIAKEYIDAEKGVETAEQAIKGASDIIAEKVSDDAELRKTLRKKITETGELSCKLLRLFCHNSIRLDIMTIQNLCNVVSLNRKNCCILKLVLKICTEN